jgi:hypothetical protein
MAAIQAAHPSMNDPTLPPAERLDVAVATYLRRLRAASRPIATTCCGDWRRGGELSGNCRPRQDGSAGGADPLRDRRPRGAQRGDATLLPSASAGMQELTGQGRISDRRLRNPERARPGRHGRRL